MLQVGDKVKVTYTDGDQFFGYIVGETAKQWKIDFDGKGEKRINKSMDVKLVDDPKTPEPEVLEVPVSVFDYSRKQSKGLNWRIALIIGATILLAAFAIGVGLDVIEVGATGLKFNF